MRCETAAEAKRATGSKIFRSFTQKVPRKGTKLRRVYDALMASKGRVVRMTMRDIRIRDLEDYYGLDIRCLKKGGRAPAQWLLAGEWFGKVYIDYVANPEAGDVAMTRDLPRPDTSHQPF